MPRLWHSVHLGWNLHSHHHAQLPHSCIWALGSTPWSVPQFRPPPGSCLSMTLFLRGGGELQSSPSAMKTKTKRVKVKEIGLPSCWSICWVQWARRVLCTFAAGGYWLSFRENWKLYGFQFELDKADNISLMRPFYFNHSCPFKMVRLVGTGGKLVWLLRYSDS